MLQAILNRQTALFSCSNMAKFPPPKSGLRAGWNLLFYLVFCAIPLVLKCRWHTLFDFPLYSQQLLVYIFYFHFFPAGLAFSAGMFIGFFRGAAERDRAGPGHGDEPAAGAPRGGSPTGFGHHRGVFAGHVGGFGG